MKTTTTLHGALKNTLGRESRQKETKKLFLYTNTNEIETKPSENVRNKTYTC